MSGKNKLIFAVVVCVIVVLFAACTSSCGGSSSSGTSWSDLSDVEKENARWAYQAQQAIDEY